MGILVRSGPLSDPEIQRYLHERFVPVALDMGCFKDGFISRDWQYQPEIVPDEEKQLFASIDAQFPMSQGFWITTPEGKLLQNLYAVTTAHVLLGLKKSLMRWEQVGTGSPLPLPQAEVDADQQFVNLSLFGRMQDGMNYEPFRDNIRTESEKWRTVLPVEVNLGDEFTLPSWLLRSIAYRLYSGELRCVLAPEEVKVAQAKGRITEVDEEITASFSGQIVIDGKATFGFNGKRGYDASLKGTVRWTKDDRTLVAFQAITDGFWQAEYPADVEPGGMSDIYPNSESPRLVMSDPMRLLFLTEYSQAIEGN